ncbi:MAG: peptide chain release factor N(5)-glutamine methyltransferase [Flavobacteriaceae bacterium]
MMKLFEAHQNFSQALLHKFTPEENRFYFKQILEILLGINPLNLALEPSQILTEAQLNQIESIILQLENDVPLQQLLGRVYFMNFELQVNTDVLIPRPETEELVQWIFQTHSEPPKMVLDCGTGSGCIAIALNKNWKSDSKIFALDLSVKALKVAQKNALLNGCDIQFINRDMAKAWNLPHLDLIVSNPPYVLLEEQNQMHPRVLKHEPHLALFSPQDDPVYFYRVIQQQALIHLKPGGWLFFEMNPRCTEELKEVFSDPVWQSFEFRNDTFGKVRFLRVQKL